MCPGWSSLICPAVRFLASCPRRPSSGCLDPRFPSPPAPAACPGPSCTWSLPTRRPATREHSQPVPRNSAHCDRARGDTWRRTRSIPMVTSSRLQDPQNPQNPGQTRLSRTRVSRAPQNPGPEPGSDSTFRLGHRAGDWPTAIGQAVRVRLWCGLGRIAGHGVRLTCAWLVEVCVFLMELERIGFAARAFVQARVDLQAVPVGDQALAALDLQ